MGIDHQRTKRRGRQLLVAMILVVGVLAPSAPIGAFAFRAHEPSPTSEPPYDDPEYSDTTYNDPAYDSTYEDPCDPAFHPDPASDPYCNPDAASFDDFATSPTTTNSAGRFANALTSRSSYETPLIELDPDEAPIVGAGRMLLAIDAIAELGGFERAITPGGAALLHDIREGIPAVGLDEFGYTLELEQFVTDFIPFLEALEADGVIVSDDLWDAADDLADVVFGDFDPATADPTELGLLEPRPWIMGLADLLVRGGEPAQIPTLEDDEVAIRLLLASFATAPSEAATTTTVAREDTPPPTGLALQLEVEPVESGSDESLMLFAAIGGLALALMGAIILLLRRRSKQRRPTLASERESGEPKQPAGPSSGRGSSNDAHRTASKASVTELLDASRRMSASLDPATIATIALNEAKRIVGAEGGIVVRRTADGLDPVGCQPPMLFNYDHIADGCLPRVIETGRSTAAIAHNEPLLVEVPMAMGAVPIVADGVVTGAILVVRISANPFDRDELDALEMLAPLVGSAFAVADTHETATELVDVEPLTGLQNRRRLDLDLASISTDDDVAYLMVDIDHFKNFNDTNGHAAGDEALRQVSALLEASVRPKDLVYRYGGEEFCVLLPGASAEEAAVVAERARAAVESAVIPGMENQPAGVVTISVGVSDSAFGTPGDLAERADAALYESKRNGRNRVTLSSVE